MSIKEYLNVIINATREYDEEDDNASIIYNAALSIAQQLGISID